MSSNPLYPNPATSPAQQSPNPSFANARRPPTVRSLFDRVVRNAPAVADDLLNEFTHASEVGALVGKGENLFNALQNPDTPIYPEAMLGTGSMPVVSGAHVARPATSLLPQPEPRPLEEHLKQQSLRNAMFGQVGENNIPIPDRDTEPTQPASDSHVRATIGGKTYEYGGGREGGAPTLAAQHAAQGGNDSYVPEGRVGGFGSHWQPAAGGGTVSMMTDNSNLTPDNSIQEAINARRVADAQPATGEFGRLGFNTAEARDFEAARLRGDRSIEDSVELQRRQGDLAAAGQAKRIEALEKELEGRYQEVSKAAAPHWAQLAARRGEFGSIKEYQAAVDALKQRIVAAKLQARNDLMWQIGMRPPSGEDMAAEMTALLGE